MSHKGHPAAQSFAGVDVEFQWGGKKSKEERKKVLIFLAFAACGAALPRAGLGAALGAAAGSAELSLSRLFTFTWKEKFKDREGTRIEGTQLSLCRVTFLPEFQGRGDDATPEILSVFTPRCHLLQPFSWPNRL